VNPNPTDDRRVSSHQRLEPCYRDTTHALRQLGTIARQLERQHRRLDPFFAQAATAFAKGVGHDAQTAAFQLEGVLDVHFLFEEKTVFPAIRSVFPDTGDELDTLCKEHTQARARLQAAVTEVLDFQFERAKDALADCTIFMEHHERRELALVNKALESARALLNSETIDPS
jgi:hypothetical protein